MAYPARIPALWTVGQEFVYPKARATELAEVSKAVVPTVAVDVADVTALKTAASLI